MKREKDNSIAFLDIEIMRLYRKYKLLAAIGVEWLFVHKVGMNMCVCVCVCVFFFNFYFTSAK